VGSLSHPPGLSAFRHGFAFALTCSFACRAAAAGLRHDPSRALSPYVDDDDDRFDEEFEGLMVDLEDFGTCAGPVSMTDGEEDAVSQALEDGGDADIGFEDFALGLPIEYFFLTLEMCTFFAFLFFV
jgi:hypothetical protein